MVSQGRLVFAVLAAALGSSFQHGYNTGVANAPQELIERFINESYVHQVGTPPSTVIVKTIFSIVVSIFSVGGMVGGLFTAVLANKLGRKGALLVNNALVFLAAIMMGLADLAGSYIMLIFGRFVIGVNSGLNAGLAPMYLNEISPVHLRGAIGTLYQLILVISILISQILGLKQILGTETGWPILFALTCVPAVMMLATLPFCPETPKFIYMNKGNEERAREALEWLRGTHEIDKEMDLMKLEFQELQSVPKVEFSHFFRIKSLFRPFLISNVVMFSQQLSGINVVFYYSTDIFLKAGLDREKATYVTLGTGVINVLMTVLSMGIIEKAGRKTLLLVGLGGLCLVTVMMTIFLYFSKYYQWATYVTIFWILVFIVFFAVGPGSIPWFLVTELFDQSARPIASSVAVAANWLANFAVGILFLPIQEGLHEYTFLIFTVLLFLFCLFIFLEVPETQGKTIPEIKEFFAHLDNSNPSSPPEPEREK
ncbi:solute carrier family 2, facilitated glucose transporter member 1-like [Uloborus diversus]|uniref:solute carrier family 2, facilitated glucose transporter member 1-like n=1 Tax=Uloborus diversus TaxID=327109 RepID=UPI002409081E|nr:solute carrier family 2, facilitated glucose transporter member 1-like [Uloborus diversus]